ncbi:MAG: ATP-binding protein [Melioribacteraceae bacterium]|nr:ATP-binding protein [Melioribacteraceae bacterium]
MNTSNKISNVQLKIKSKTENLSEVRSFAEKIANQLGFSEDSISKIILAIDEACTNIIKHAYKYDPDGDIIISFSFNGNKLSISILDYGNHFDPDKIPEPDIKEYYKQKKSGGLGMFLMKKLMDEVVYSTTSGSYNQVTLIKYLS